MNTKKITITQIQSIEASELLTRFDKLDSRLNQLQEMIKPQPETILLTRQEVAKWLDISLPTLHKYTNNGVLQAHRIGSKVRYKQNEVLDAFRTD